MISGKEMKGPSIKKGLGEETFEGDATSLMRN
jgi:hypothetical protein